MHELVETVDRRSVERDEAGSRSDHISKSEIGSRIDEAAFWAEHPRPLQIRPRAEVEVTVHLDAGDATRMWMTCREMDKVDVYVSDPVERQARLVTGRAERLDGELGCAHTHHGINEQVGYRVDTRIEPREPSTLEVVACEPSRPGFTKGERSARQFWRNRSEHFPT